MFSVYADPRFHRFDEGFKRFFFLPNEYLTINVSRIVSDVCGLIVYEYQLTGWG